MYKIFIKLQTSSRTFFGVKLRSKNIISSCGAAKWQTVNSFAQSLINVVRHSIVTMNEIKITAIGHPVPQGVRLELSNLIPAHLRNFEA